MRSPRPACCVRLLLALGESDTYPAVSGGGGGAENRNAPNDTAALGFVENLITLDYTEAARYVFVVVVIGDVMIGGILVLRSRSYLMMKRCCLGFSPDRPSVRLRAPSTPFDAPRPCGSNDPPPVSFGAKQPISSVRTIDKTMSDGHEHALSGTEEPSLAPPRLLGDRHQSGRDASRGRSGDRHRAFWSALTCASPPHARTHARTRGGRGGTGGCPASFPLRILARCACDVDLSDERARAASGGDAPRHRESHIARAHVGAQVRTSLLLRMWVALLPGRGSYTGGGARLPRCTRGDGRARALRGSAARYT